MEAKNALIDTIYYDESPADERDDCEIRINNGEIVVSYEDEDGVVIYKGKDKGNDHYVLRCPERNGKASLHRFPNNKILEGFWLEDGYRGFWRITIL